MVPDRPLVAGAARFLSSGPPGIGNSMVARVLATPLRLFLDEADALSSRSFEVMDAHDRYTNLEINYLSQRIERFDGLAMLTTNLCSPVG